MTRATSPSKGKGKEKTYFCWTPEMDKLLGTCFIEEMNRGNKVEGKCAWKPASWKAAIYTLNEQLNADIDKPKIINRLKTWGKHYDALHPLLDSNNSNSPITWDYAKGRIEVHDENVWREHLQANPKLTAYRAGKIIIENWGDICTLFAKDGTRVQGARTNGEANVDVETNSSNAEEPSNAQEPSNAEEPSNEQGPFQADQRTAEEDGAMSMAMAQQECLKRKENAPSASSHGGMKRKLCSSELFEGLRQFFMVESQRATTKEVLKELDTVNLNITQKLKALDMMMQNQRLFETFSGLPNHLRLPWVLMHLEE